MLFCTRVAAFRLVADVQIHATQGTSWHRKSPWKLSASVYCASAPGRPKRKDHDGLLTGWTVFKQSDPLGMNGFACIKNRCWPLRLHIASRFVYMFEDMYCPYCFYEPVWNPVSSVSTWWLMSNWSVASAWFACFGSWHLLGDALPKPPHVTSRREAI